MTDLDATIRAVVRDEIQRSGLIAPARALTVREAADRLSVDPKTVRRLVQRGELRAVRVGSKALRILSSDVDALLEGGAS
jgi:excisionase family DNA binding protein